MYNTPERYFLRTDVEIGFKVLMYICLPEITEEYDIKWMTGLLLTKCLMNGMHSLYILHTIS